jgi:hypothetical protein
LVQSVGSPALWAVTIAFVVALLAVDFLATRRPHEVSLREAGWWSALYVAIPLAFGGFVWARFGTEAGTEYLTGYLVEKSLSVDNLFVFMLLLGAFAVPPALRQRVLLYGIVGALLLRGVFIALGAAALDRFAATFLVFGLVLLATAVKVLRDDAVRPRRPGGRRRDPLGAAAPPVLPGHRRLPRHAPVGPRERPPGADTARRRHVRRPGDRRRLRDRLGARGLRHHRGPVPRRAPRTRSRCSACGRCSSWSPGPWSASCTSATGWR